MFVVLTAMYIFVYHVLIFFSGDLMDSLLGGGNTSEAPDIAMDIISDDVD